MRSRLRGKQRHELSLHGLLQLKRDVFDVLTFIPGNLDIGKKTDFDDLPEKPQDQVRLSFLEILSTDVDHRAADGGGGVQG